MLWHMNQQFSRVDTMVIFLPYIVTLPVLIPSVGHCIPRVGTGKADLDPVYKSQGDAAVSKCGAMGHVGFRSFHQ